MSVSGLTDGLINNQVEEFHYSDSDPIFASGSVGSVFGWASSTADISELYGATAGDDAWYYEARASSLLHFQPKPHHTSLMYDIYTEFAWSAWPELSFSYQLLDLTNNQILFSFDQTDGIYNEHQISYLSTAGVVAIDPTHQYEFQMELYAGSYGGTSVEMEIIDFNAIPEPVTSLILASGSLVLIRRRIPRK